MKELDGVRPVLARLRARFAGDRARRRDLGVMVALLDLFESARDIFRFYGLRRDAVFASRTRGDAAAARAAVAEMRRILARERELSREMVPLCDDDSRLGFHSEAEAHQFTSDYLRWRVGELDKAEAALGEIDAALAAGRPYPESARERGAETIDAEELADGSLVIAGTCPELTPGQGMELRAANIAEPKKFEVRTPDVVVRVNPERSDLIETRVIDGLKYILIRADEGVEVNGVNISIASAAAEADDAPF